MVLLMPCSKIPLCPPWREFSVKKQDKTKQNTKQNPEEINSAMFLFYSLKNMNRYEASLIVG